MGENGRAKWHKLPLQIAKGAVVSALLLVNSVDAFGQNTVTVKGVVTSGTDGLPLIGVNVLEKGTTNGTVTDIDGNFSLTLPAGSQLQISYIGFLEQTLTVSEGQTELNVVMKEDSQSLDEVVVVGYGVQKKKLVTGATVQVKGDDLQKLSTNSALGALQSQTPGVQIKQASGRPGEGFKVNVRGVGTIGDSAPLYVIDGIAGGDINNLNPSDIESVDVLKDAASAAIYGARAANGVILVTTKQGKAGKMQISYDGYVGWQTVSKWPNSLNARQYMEVQDAMNTNMGKAAYDWQSLLPDYIYQGVMDGTWNGTDWVRELANEGAMTQNHSVNLTGGNETSKFSMGVSYTGQEGIFGNPVDPTYKRITARVNSDHVLLKGSDFDIIKIGENFTYTYTDKSNMPAIGDIYGNDMHNALGANPLLPVYTRSGEWYDQNAKDAEGWTFDGTETNPIAQMALSDRGNNRTKNYGLQGNLYLEIQPIKNLKWRSVFGYKMNSNSYRAYSGAYYLGTTTQSTTDRIDQNMSSVHQYTWENTISYSWKINEDHAFDAVIGQSIEKWGLGEYVGASTRNSIFPGDFDYAYINNGKPNALNEVSLSGYPQTEGALASFFGRVNYNYKEKYMASIVMRGDGSANFARGNRWGFFPSVSAGWVITNEDFMESMRDSWLDFFKLRASWGRNGNSNIDNFQYLATVAMDNGNRYFFGNDKLTPSTGAYADILPNEDVTWETSEQWDIGFDARLLNSRLGINFDWYQKTTKDWLVEAPVLSSYGTGAPYINGGDVRNRGVEIALTWNDQVGEDFTYGVSFNIGTNKNEVTRIANTEGIIHGPANVLSQGTTEMYRVQVGYPIGYFWGYQTAGIFQDQAQIDNYVANGGAVYDGVQPGDAIFVDTNGDGQLSDADKTMIGKGTPDWTFGINLNGSYKNFDISMLISGSIGQDILDVTRRLDCRYVNLPAEFMDRWHGEGTSNTMPRFAWSNDNDNYRISDLYVKNGNYARIKNLQIGYTLPKAWTNKFFVDRLRVYVAAENLLTITPYDGLDPELGGDESSNGIDRGYYPQARTFMVGLNLGF